ncbi:uncharacterized protein [Montipora foliosa]|uniref:uncharacterized protein n=1 Tax=Montipora foliosa TaxID=591990 RepID=UPI0035F1C1D3
MTLTPFLRLIAVFALWKLFVTEAETTIPVCSPDNNNIDVSAKGQGVIATPNFPNGHKSASCVWKIQAPNNLRLAITIDVLKLQNWEDHIVIRDGPNESTPLIGKYGPCASGSVTLFSSDSSVYLQANFPDFSSNNELRITYSPVNPDDISCSNQEENLPNLCSADTKIQQNSGVISSPNFPNNYGASQSCVWTITAPEGYRVQVTIHWFGVEDHRYSPNRPGSCYDDSLIISEAVGSESRQIDKLCGCKGLLTSVSSQEKMWLEFSSYKKANWPGFYATYQTLSPEECPAGDTNCTIKTMPAVGFDAQGQVCTVQAKTSSSLPKKTSSPSPSLSLSRKESSAMTSSQVQKTSNELASKTSTTSRLSPSSVPIQIKSSIIQELLNSTQVTNPSINKEKANSMAQTSSLETRSPFVSKTTSLISSPVGSAATTYILQTLETRTHDRSFLVASSSDKGFAQSFPMESSVELATTKTIKISSEPPPIWLPKSPVKSATKISSQELKTSRVKATSPSASKSMKQDTKSQEKISVNSESSIGTSRVFPDDKRVATATLYGGGSTLGHVTSAVSARMNTSGIMKPATQKRTHAMMPLSKIATPISSIDFEHSVETSLTMLSPKTSSTGSTVGVTKTSSFATEKKVTVERASSVTPRLSKAHVSKTLLIGTEERKTVKAAVKLNRTRKYSKSVDSSETEGPPVTEKIVKSSITSEFESGPNGASTTEATKDKAVSRPDIVRPNLSTVFHNELSSKAVHSYLDTTTTRTDSKTAILEPSGTGWSTRWYQSQTFVHKSTRVGRATSLVLLDHVSYPSQQAIRTSKPERTGLSKASEIASKTTSSDAPTLPENESTTQQPRVTDTAPSGGIERPPKGISVRCTHYGMDVTISRSLYPSLVISSLHLMDPECKVLFANDTHALLRTPLEDCDTERTSSEDYMVYINTIMGEAKSSNSIPLITREGRVQFRFQCSYRRIHVLSIVSFSPRRKAVRTSDSGMGNFTFEMDMFEDPDYDVVINQYPLDVLLGQTMYLQVDVKSRDTSLLAFLEECWVTPTPNPRDPTRYTIIQHGCPRDSTLKYTYQKSSTQKFSFQAFKFRQVPSSRLYVHCKVDTCRSSDSGSVCDMGCVEDTRRRREIQAYMMDKDVFLTLGPVNFRDGNTENTSSSMVYIQALMAVLGFLVLVLLIAIVVVTLRKRKRKKNEWMLIPSKTQKPEDQDAETSKKLMEQTTEL